MASPFVLADKPERTILYSRMMSRPPLSAKYNRPEVQKTTKTITKLDHALYDGIMRLQQARRIGLSRPAPSTPNRNWGITAEYKGDRATRDYLNKKAARSSLKQSIKQGVKAAISKGCQLACVKPLTGKKNAETKKSKTIVV